MFCFKVFNFKKIEKNIVNNLINVYDKTAN